MIEGIKIDVHADELKEHITRRGNEHREKAENYQRQIDAFSAAEVSPPSSRTSVDPLRDLRYKLQEHQDKAAFFFFMAEHLVMDEIYRLGESDLARLEIAAMYF